MKSSASRTAAGSRAVLTLADILRPCALDEGENGPDLAVGEDLIEGRHVALVSRRRIRPDPMLHHAEEDLVRMVPGVPARVMRRRGKAPAGKAPSPIRLTLPCRHCSAAR